jgi:hypothetical protein
MALAADVLAAAPPTCAIPPCVKPLLAVVH